MECMRIFLDANILISGILFTGNEHTLLLKNSTITFIISEDVYEETLNVIEKKFSESRELAEAFISTVKPFIVKRKKYIHKLEKYVFVRDKNDRHILAAAQKSNANYIVSGDKDLLSIKEYQGTHIVTAKKMLSVLK
jgi:putative PIN family toxin of toxin-antitoxin system